jgi:hypothetical protein
LSLKKQNDHKAMPAPSQFTDDNIILDGSTLFIEMA